MGTCGAEYKVDTAGGGKMAPNGNQRRARTSWAGQESLGKGGGSVWVGHAAGQTELEKGALGAGAVELAWVKSRRGGGRSFQNSKWISKVSYLASG